LVNMFLKVFPKHLVHNILNSINCKIYPIMLVGSKGLLLNNVAEEHN
jgi:hypothetical protein